MEKIEKRDLKPIEVCPNGHTYNTWKSGDVCDVCGEKLDLTIRPALTPEKLKELIYIEAKKRWVCGWLVCVDGLNKGRAYRVCAGRNFVGGNSNMEIQILGDHHIRRDNHTIISYDERKRATMLLAGDSRGMVYLDDKAVYESIELQPFDKIGLGNGVYTYVPLCREEFGWTDNDKEAIDIEVVQWKEQMSRKPRYKRKLFAIERCSNGHWTHTDEYGEICEICGKVLDPPPPESLTPEEVKELTHVDREKWVHGWLVCISGPTKGWDYEIRKGRSFIGGSESMDIHIPGDKLIEKVNHAVITYDDYDHSITLQPGNSRGMVYVQGDAIHKARELVPSDKIEIGESTFMYVPFCTQEFNWSKLEFKSESQQEQQEKKEKENIIPETDNSDLPSEPEPDKSGRVRFSFSDGST